MVNSEEIEKIATMYGNFYSRKVDLITTQLKKFSAHTRNELAMLKSLIKEGDNVIDIGAHLGTFSIPFARFNEEKGRIFSFEADVDNYNLLLMNISENCLIDVIKPVHAIISDSQQKFSVLKPCDDNSGMHCFLPIVASADLHIAEAGVIHIDEWYAQNEADTRIDLIKIDIEGAEMAALRSCKKIITKYLPMIYMEINIEALNRFGTTITEIEEALKSFGYHFFRNNGPRNSCNDTFKIARLDTIADGGVFYDLLAIHPSSGRYPDLAES